MNAHIYIGPAGWSYPDWNGIVYPKTAPDRFDALPFLASYFNLIEVNSTFYRVPRPSTTASWARRVSHRPDFQFTVKAFREFTHGKKPATRSDVESFTRAIEPLRVENRLSTVLIQFPWSFRFSPETTRYIADLVTWFSPCPAAVEVRHGSWALDAARAFFVENRIGMCGIDQPQVSYSLPPDRWVADRSSVYFRLHGRNEAEWFKPGTNRDRRYDYLYSVSELSEWAERIRQIANEVSRIHVVLNNHFRGQAVANALAMAAMVFERRVAAPRGIRQAYPNLSHLFEESEPEGSDLHQRSERSLFENSDN